MSEEQPKEYYEKKPGFVVKSGTVNKTTGKTTDYSVITDNLQGFIFTTDGEHQQMTRKTSYELSGIDGKDGVPGKVIRVKKGDIVIEAMDGDVIIRGNNVRIVALDGAGEVTVNPGKQFSVNAPVTSIKGGVGNMVMTNSASIGAQSVDTNGNIQNSAANGAEESQGSILSQLLGVLKKFQKFLE